MEILQRAQKTNKAAPHDVQCERGFIEPERTVLRIYENAERRADDTQDRCGSGPPPFAA